ncbi:MAG TPA: PAS-domain containing protein, partial [Acetobacteraceae bacterium]
MAALHFALVALLAGWLLREQQARRRRDADFNLIAERDRVQAAKMAAILQGMPDGILVVDGDLRLVEWNDRFPELAGVPSGMLRVGLDLSDLLRAQAAAGEFGPVDVDAEVERRMTLLRSGGSTGVIERVRPNGKVLEVRCSPLPEGGFVTLYTDVSA